MHPFRTRYGFASLSVGCRGRVYSPFAGEPGTDFYRQQYGDGEEGIYPLWSPNDYVKEEDADIKSEMGDWNQIWEIPYCLHGHQSEHTTDGQLSFGCRSKNTFIPGRHWHQSMGDLKPIVKFEQSRKRGTCPECGGSWLERRKPKMLRKMETEPGEIIDTHGHHTGLQWCTEAGNLPNVSKTLRGKRIEKLSWTAVLHKRRTQ